MIPIPRLVLSMVFAAVAGLGGCDSGEPLADDTPAATTGSTPATETRNTAVHFLTVRNLTGADDPEERFGDERDVIRAGRCHASFTPIRILDRIARNMPLYIPSDDQEIDHIELLPMQTFWNEFVSANTGERPILYVHGYNVGFAKGCFRAARFAGNLELERRLLFYSWPSDGSALNYTRDEADLHWSVKSLREVISRMEILFGRGNFDVVGHSLGARGVVLALAGMSDFHGSSEALVDRLILVAADMDADIFAQHLPRLRARARHLTAYVSDNDSALVLSRELHGYPRLGEASVHVVGLQGVDVIDVSDLPLRRVSGHLYHLYNPEAYTDLYELIHGRLDAGSRSVPERVDPTVPNLWRLPSQEDQAVARDAG